ncbi:hypothetical protein ND860_18170 [Leptospira levettii]|uniref:hypothetical protein n=1 Tax=Leptospira levettii TaxID=2023178 RepID=UPI00223D6BEE|nr:hypothetical protein [Leptospira levettii]MCW7498468.1 hypothetical protein [Leptospira levettii]
MKVILLYVVFSIFNLSFLANPSYAKNLKISKCFCKAENEPGLGWTRRFNPNLSRRLACTMNLQNISDKVLLKVNGTILLKTKNGYELSSFNVESPKDYYKRNTEISLTTHVAFEERFHHADCIINQIFETTVVKKAPNEQKNNFIIRNCFCKKEKVPLAGIMNSLEPDSGFEFICKASIKNATNTPYKRALVLFNLMTQNGYLVTNHKIWSELDNFAPGKSIEVKTSTGAIPFNARINHADCEVIQAD